MSKNANGFIKALFETYIVPDEWKNNPKISQAETTKWEESVTRNIKKGYLELVEDHERLCTLMLVNHNSVHAG